MKKEILQKINNLAKFIFDEVNFNKFFALIANNELNEARLFLDSQLDELKMLLELTDNEEGLLNQYKQCDELFDIVIDLIIKSKDAYGEGRQIRITA